MIEKIIQFEFRLSTHLLPTPLCTAASPSSRYSLTSRRSLYIVDTRRLGHRSERRHHALSQAICCCNNTSLHICNKQHHHSRPPESGLKLSIRAVSPFPGKHHSSATENCTGTRQSVKEQGACRQNLSMRKQYVYQHAFSSHVILEPR